MVTTLTGNHRAGFVAGNSPRMPSQVETRKKSGIPLFIQKIFPF